MKFEDSMQNIDVHSSYYIGVDGGGTKTKITVMNAEGVPVARASAGAGNIRTSARQAWQSFEEALLQCLSREQIKNSDIHVLFGSAGTESLTSVKKFKQLQPDYIASCEVVSDAYTACIGAHKCHYGAIIIIGTGVIGYQLEDDMATQVGGWGFPHCDEGGGAWLGMHAVRLAFKAYDGLVEPSLLTRNILSQCNNNPHALLETVFSARPGDFGKFAPLVVSCAKENDSYAIALLSESGKYVCQIADALKAKQCDADLALPLTLIGGLADFITPYITPEVAQRLTSRLADTVSGALWLLRRKFSLKGFD